MNTRKIFKREFSAENLIDIYTKKIAASDTVGKDGIHPSSLEKIMPVEAGIISSRVHKSEYKFTTFKQKLVSKGAGKIPRQISIATTRDRIVLRALTNVLMERFTDAKLSPAHDIVRDISYHIKEMGEDNSFIQIDLKNFFPSVDHAILMKRVRSQIRHFPTLDLITKAITTPTGISKSLSPNICGIPQGLSISNILSSVYMLKFDTKARNNFTYFRYVDDILIICNSDNAVENLNLLSRELKKIGLECHSLEERSKTKIVPINNGVDYLGYNIKKSIISVRESSFKNMINNLIKIIAPANKNKNIKRTLERLNLRITGCTFSGKRMGWMFFFSLTQNISQLKRLDAFVEKKWKKNGLDKYGKPKTFVKSYYEINYNYKNTKYIPQFDEYSTEEKIDFLSNILNVDARTIANWSKSEIEKQFAKTVRKEVVDLEKDMTPVS